MCRILLLAVITLMAMLPLCAQGGDASYRERYADVIGWHLIGRRNGDDGFLEFDNVPEGCLLLLKDKTAGGEERIFEYMDGIQVWY